MRVVVYPQVYWAPDSVRIPSQGVRGAVDLRHESPDIRYHYLTVHVNHPPLQGLVNYLDQKTEDSGLTLYYVQ